MKGLFRLARLLLPHWRPVLLGVLLSLATILANIGLLSLSSWFIASMAIAGSTGAFLNYALPAAGVRALALARAGGRYAERLVNHDTTLRILSGLRVWFYQRLEPLAPAGLARYRSGDLLSRIRSDIDSLDDFFVRGVVPSLVAGMAAGLAIPFLVRFDARLAWIDAAALAACGILLPLALRTLAARPGREGVACAAELRASIVEEIHGMAELVAFGSSEAHALRVRAASRAMDSSARAVSSLQGVADAGIVAASSAAAWAAALVLVGAVQNGLRPADMAMLTVFVLASFEIIAPLPAIIQRTGEMAEAARRLFEIIDAEPAVAERLPSRVACPCSPQAGAVGLEVRALRFRYAPDLPWAIDGLSLDAPAGSRVAVVGPSGAGKSSLINVLLRFWDYEGGSIRIVEGAIGAQGCDLRSFSADDSRRLFSVVPQSPYLFHASIRANLLVASPSGEGPADDELWSRLEAAQLEELVAALPDGLDTVVGESGAAMSVGEVQRIAVARALLKNAPVYLLDEPTEGLDDRTADRLLAAVERRLRGRTVVIASHRPRDISLADRVFDLGARLR